MPSPRNELRTTLLIGVLVTLAGCLAPWDADPAAYNGHDHASGHHHDGAHTHDGGTAGGQEEDQGTRPYTGNETVTLEVAAGTPGEFRFSPYTYELPAGTAVGVIFSNEGRAEHELAIPATGFHVHAHPGQTVRASFQAPDQAGEYAMGCYLPGHYESGMRGTLVVT